MVKSKNQKGAFQSKAASCKKQSLSGSGQSAAEGDSDVEVESEVLTLQQTCQRLSGVRQAQERETLTTIRRQRHLIGSLIKEREELLLSLKGVEGREDHENRSIQALLQRSDDLDNCITRENDKLHILDKEIHNIQRKMDRKRNVFHSTEDRSRKMERLTNQIAQANCRFGSLVSTNSNLRQEIQTMRGEKNKFLLIRNRLQKELQDKQKEIGSLLDEANECLHMREEAQSRTVRVQEQRAKETEQHEGEVREIQRALSHTRKGEHFLREKAKEREHDRNFLCAVGKKEARARERRMEQKVVLNQYEEAVEKIGEIVDQATRGRVRGGKRRSRVADGRSGSAAEGLTESEHKRPLWDLVSRRRSTLVSQMFRETLGGEGEAERRGRRLTEHRRRSTLLLGASLEEQERLKELARKTLEQQQLLDRNAADFDAELFYNVYMEREDVNFALFNYVCEQTGEIEDLTRNIQQLKWAVELQHEGDAAAGEKRKERGRRLEETREEVAHIANKLQTDVEKKVEVLRLIKAGVESIADHLGLRSVYTEISGDAPRAIFFLLGIIEQKVTDMLSVQSYTESQEVEGAGRKMEGIGHFLGILPPHTPPAVSSIQPPSTSLLFDSEEECDEEDLKPLSKEELQLKAVQSIQSRADKSTA